MYSEKNVNKLKSCLTIFMCFLKKNDQLLFYKVLGRVAFQKEMNQK